jgi:hypothetical protein
MALRRFDVALAHFVTAPHVLTAAEHVPADHDLAGIFFAVADVVVEVVAG